MSGNKINPTRTVDIPPYDGSESFTVWLRRAKFYLREIAEADRPWTLLKALAPKQLDKALDAGLDADLSFDALCQRLANLFSHTYSFGDAMEQLQKRRLNQEETLNQLVEDLQRLTTVAFPYLGSADKDNTVLYYFIKALPTPDLSRSLLLQPPDSLQEAVTRAERYLRMCPPTSRPLPPEDAHGRDAHPTSAGPVPTPVVEETVDMTQPDSPADRAPSEEGGEDGEREQGNTQNPVDVVPPRPPT
nr:unnamed protein product [Spirometra erinaceieuropaei]